MINKIKHFFNKDKSEKKLNFFPNRERHLLNSLHKIRNIASSIPDEERYELFSELSNISENFITTKFKLVDNKVLANQESTEIYFPYPLPTIKFCHLLCGYEDWLYKKYALPGFVEVEEGDIVVDCGAYVAGFSLSAIKLASQLHVFEPDVNNFECCLKNLDGYSNIYFNNAGLYNETKIVEFHISSSSVEHSILLPDDGVVLKSVKLKVFSLMDYCKSNNINRIDFLKLEAEGVEPEIYEGLKTLKPQKIAIDVSPEREGASPRAYFEEVLEKAGYEVIVRGHVLFARIKSL